MPLTTTVLGAYPKPDYVPIRDWFTMPGGQVSASATHDYDEALLAPDAEAEALFARAATEVIADQEACGIDIVTDGEVRRENYIHYHCRHLAGIDFSTLTHKVLRDGAYETDLPTVRGDVAPRGGHFLPHDYRAAQASTNKPVKVTLPGPMTISDTTADAHYGDPAKLGADLARALNYEILALVDAGCRHIQVDEPLFARKPAETLEYGFENLNRCFEGVADNVARAVHICCGYPTKLDDQDYRKADPNAYLAMADALDASVVDQISIEDAHRHNDLSLLRRFRQTTVIFGSIAIASSALEPVSAIRRRLQQALEHIDAERLIVAPDCGLGFLTRDLAMRKLTHMTEAARSV
ncbi:MAG: cobalamin-independent methionine synthase II family protein [Alphaproteobacteria bacterium]|nr:cobalamin-independent methionine synthase II family protein [Alphaproteobacteria bacterium]